MKTSVLVYSCILLMIISIAGVVYSGRVALAQIEYHNAKYGRAAADSEWVASLCKKAAELYPYNYNFCIWTAEKAYYSSFNCRPDLSEKRVAIAQEWCDAGLELNPFRSQLRRLKTCLLARSSPAAAVKYWEKYVDWQYWEPANHALLVELYSLTGDFDRASESLSLIKGTAYFDEANAKITNAWNKEAELPRDIFTKPAVFSRP